MASVARCLRLLQIRLAELLLVLSIGYRKADAKTAVTVDAGATLMQASSVDASSFDALASVAAGFAAMSLSPDSGCTLGGVSLEYIFPSMAVKTPALVVDVDLLNTTVTADTGIVLSLRELGLEDLLGTRGNQDFLDLVCRQPATFLFTRACDFFKPSNLAVLCYSLASLLQTSQGRSFGALSTDDPFLLRTNDLALLHTDMRDDLQVARGSPCRSSGLSIRYAFSDLSSALEVDVTPLTATIWTDTSMARIFSKLGLGDLFGSHTFDDFLSIVCRKASKQVLPKACDFFAPSHLGNVCDAMSPLLGQRPEVRDFDYTLVSAALPVEEDPFMLRPELSTGYTSTGEQLGLFQTARESPCTPVGMQLRYFAGGGMLALDVLVRPDVTTATASTVFSTALSKAGMLDMVGTHNTDAFRSKMCRTQGKHFFPYACDFFANQHLGSLCSSGSPLSSLLQQSAQTWLKSLE